MTKQKHLGWIDLVRTLAIMGVVLSHCVEGTFPLTLKGMRELDFPLKTLVFTLFTIGRISPVLFMMVSGYLLLDREYDAQACRRFWKKNWLHLLIVTEFWFLIYDLFELWFSGTVTSPARILYDLLFIHKVNLSHVWYMPVILGIYVLLPFAAMGLRSIGPGPLRFPLLFFSFYAFGYPLFKVIHGALDLSYTPALQLSMGFSGGAYGLYFLMGYFVKKGGLRKYKSSLLLILAAAGIALGVWLQLWAYGRGYEYNIWIDCVFITIPALAVFELLRRNSGYTGGALIRILAKYSFAVYLVHNPIRKLVQQYMIRKMSFPKPWKMLLLWVLTLLFSMVLSLLIARIPRVGKYLLYIREKKQKTT